VTHSVERNRENSFWLAAEAGISPSNGFSSAHIQDISRASRLPEIQRAVLLQLTRRKYYGAMFDDILVRAGNAGIKTTVLGGMGRIDLATH